MYAYPPVSLLWSLDIKYEVRFYEHAVPPALSERAGESGNIFILK
jgi:hypothetical protein